MSEGSRRSLLGALIAATVSAALLWAGVASVRATEPTTEAQILEALKARRVLRCPSSGDVHGCGGAPGSGQPAETPAIDVEIFFDNASARLNPMAMSTLAALEERLREPKFEGLSFMVTGHASASGSARFNQRLSEQRAGAVKRIMTETFNYPASALDVVGYGKSRPRNTADPFAAENRRVRIAPAGRT